MQGGVYQAMRANMGSSGSEEGAEVLELRERQLRNVPEELGWWYRVDSKTMGRFCNRCVLAAERGVGPPQLEGTS